MSTRATCSCRGHRDDAASTTVLHPRKDSLDKPKGGHEVQVHSGEEVGVTHVLHRLRFARRATRVRDQHIDRPETVLGFPNETPDVVGNGQVRHHRTTDTTPVNDLATYPRQGVGVAAM